LQDPETRAEIQRLVDVNDEAELERRLRTRIAFGTAGLRAKMEAGFSRLNSLTIIQASQGLAAYLRQVCPDATTQGIVIGHDARHNSEKFATLTATTFVESGFKIWWYEDLVHTPMVPFGVKFLGAAAGVMVTASHVSVYEISLYFANDARPESSSR
jgi:phosphoglucomutase